MVFIVFAFNILLVLLGTRGIFDAMKTSGILFLVVVSLLVHTGGSAMLLILL